MALAARFVERAAAVRPKRRRPYRFARSSERACNGAGMYLRTDFWVKISSGGSYGHTCHVAKELAATSAGFACVMANRYALLDDFGLHQIVVPPPSQSSNESDLLAGTDYFHPILKVAVQAVKPAYIYERLCLGNYAGALISREFQIPYIVEYNGSEISMRRSFDGSGFAHEDAFTLRGRGRVQAGDADHRRVGGGRRVADRARDRSQTRSWSIPTAPTRTSTRPPGPAERAALRGELGFRRRDRVIGFSGTFGGWHGVDVLAAAIPRICAANRPTRASCLIGDGSYKHLVDDAVTRPGLQDRVKSVGRVPQSEGARLLKACDIFVSPHNSHMVDSRFFGSPTKLFEYMAMGGGIVGSDLEQLGEVLSPALRPSDLPAAGHQRARGAVRAW